MAEGEHVGKATLTDPVQPSVSADINIVGFGSHSPPPTKAITVGATPHNGDESQESGDARGFEVDIVKPASPGNLTANLAQVDCSFASHEFDELLDYFSKLNAPLTPLFTRDTDFNFFSSVEKAPSTFQTSPPPVIPPPSLQVTPPSASQPGS